MFIPDDPENKRLHLEWIASRKAKIELADRLRLYGDERLMQVANRLERCGNYVQLCINKGRKTVKNISHCFQKVCIECMHYQHYRQLVRFKSAIELFLQQTINPHFILLNVGFKNVPINECRKTIIDIANGFKRMTRKENKLWPAEGSITSKEWTISDDKLIHFNCHSFLVVPRSYFRSDRYLDQHKWQKEICNKFAISGIPWIKRVGQYGEPLADQVLKTFSYITEPHDYLVVPEVTIPLMFELAGTKMVNFSGKFRDFRRQHYTKSQLTDSTIEAIWVWPS
jgi:hypothetical protein